MKKALLISLSLFILGQEWAIAASSECSGLINPGVYQAGCSTQADCNGTRAITPSGITCVKPISVGCGFCVSACSTTKPCPSGYNCSNNYCWKKAW